MRLIKIAFNRVKSRREERHAGICKCLLRFEKGKKADPCGKTAVLRDMG